MREHRISPDDSSGPVMAKCRFRGMVEFQHVDPTWDMHGRSLSASEYINF